MEGDKVEPGADDRATPEGELPEDRATPEDSDENEGPDGYGFLKRLITEKVKDVKNAATWLPKDLTGKQADVLVVKLKAVKTPPLIGQGEFKGLMKEVGIKIGR